MSDEAMQILVVEDDVEICELVRECLADAGHGVATANSGTAAATFIALHPDLDLLVTDFNLGTALDGVDIAKQFRSHYPDAAVLMISGRPDLARSKLKDCEPIGLLSKPFHISDLLLAVERSTSSRASFGTSRSA